ncbi:MAG: glycosyltransferase family 39 protein [bacterium]|nr:glycosyltransferase family 39 protein [bacterium]
MSEFFNKNRTLLWILLTSFLMSFTYSLYYQIDPAVDARAYDNIARNIINGNGYRESVELSLDRDFSIARVGPLYEYFLAGVYAIFGHNYYIVWFLQALLHALTALLVYLIALKVFADSDKREKIALWSAVIVGLHPDLIEISAMLMTETLYLFLFSLLLYIFFADTSVALLGLVSGFAVMARPPVLFCLPVIFFYLYRKKTFKEILLFSVILAAVFIPWTARNYIVYGEVIPLGVAGQLNFWIGNHVGGNGEQEMSQEIVDFAETHSIKELGNESVKQFKNFILNYPAEFIKLTILRINKYFSIIRPMGFWFYTSGWRQMLFVASSVLASIILFIAGMAGAIKMLKERKEKYNYLIAFAVLTPLILFITVVETRYRFQIYPILALFAGYFIATFSSTDQQLKKILFVSIFLVLLNGGIDLFMNSGLLLARISSWL